MASQSRGNRSTWTRLSGACITQTTLTQHSYTTSPVPGKDVNAMFRQFCFQAVLKREEDD